MGERSNIEWTDATWNPATGCTKISPGCAHCYIERTPPFRIHHRRFDCKGTTGIALHPERLMQPFKWRKPRRVFVNSLSDLFHEEIPDEFIDRVFAVMVMRTEHIFQVLTKRPKRMLEYLRTGRRRLPILGDFDSFAEVGCVLPNIWLGVTVENQHFADERIPLLMRTPAITRFISYEPALGPLQFSRLHEHCPVHDFSGGFCAKGCPYLKGIDWLICGGESGPHARPMNLDWARSVREQCRESGIAFFMKQICERGRKIPFEDWPEDLRVREMPEY